ncbi:MAG TPA: MerR family transcriptional regulator [Gryllotalpicola sp.]
MGWSTRELAQLAGTTLRTVRHYHEIGLLPEPQRLPNGYKSYRTEHLVRLLEIRRLSGLGLSLTAIAEIEGGSGDRDEALLAAEAELDAAIGRLQHARSEIAKLRAVPVPTDLPFEISIAATSAQLSQTDRSLFAVMSHLADGAMAPHWQELIEDYRPDEATAEFDALPADADERTRELLAARMVPQAGALAERHPWPPEHDQLPAGRGQQSAQTVISAMLDLYNPAQLDVLVRVWRAVGLI